MPQTGTLLLLGAMYSVTALGLLRSYTYIPSSVATTINFYTAGRGDRDDAVSAKKFRLAAGCDPHLTGGCGAAFVGRYRRSAERPCHRRRRVRGSDRADLHDLYRRCEKKPYFPARSDDPAFYVLLFSACFFLVYALSTTGAPLPGKWHLWQNLLLLAWCRPLYPT